MTIKIPVEADFKGESVDQQLQAFQQKLNALGQQIAKANKAKFEPISNSTVQNMQRMTQQFQTLLRVSGDLRKRVNDTGQQGRGFVDLDWGAMYPDAGSRARQQAKAYSYVTGQSIAPLPGKRPPGQTPAWQQIGANVAHAGLRAANGVTGGVGGVASSALGTGMSSGFGAGMAGLLGGIVALGVGKIIGAATEKIGQAEDNAVAYDKIKRTLGDVNVSFSGLKTALEGAASNVKVTFDEAARLSMQFAKLGNMTNDQYSSLSGELQTGVGMSRSLGLDPSQGVGFLGTMRGMRQTQDEQGSRRMALLIGETIAKSNAFAKSDEVMEAISNYVTTQTRSSFGANVGGYAGMYSSMVGSGIPGMDPTGAAGMLGRINSSLMAGGAKGEASQFFTAMVGQGMGLDPLQTQLLRESGAFATPDAVFGKGSIYERATGRTGPGGSQTFLGGTRDLLGRAYGGNSEQEVMLRAQATGNHLGISMTQALALGTLQPNQMGDLQKTLEKSGLKLGDINMGGLAAMSKVVSGTSSDRLGVASELWSRTGKGALSADERARLDATMKTGSEQEQKELLTALVASRDQEMTQGKDIRDSKTALENIKTTLADQLLPVTQSMRDGIMWLAGGKDGKSEKTIREDMAKASINEKYDAQIKELQEEASNIKGGGPFSAFSNGPEQTEYINKHKAIRDKIAALNEQRGKETAAALADINKKPEAPYSEPNRMTPEGWRAPGGAGAGAAALGSATASGDTTSAMKFFMDRGWSKDQAAGIVANLQSESGMRTGAVGDSGRAYGVAQWHPDRQANFERWSGKSIRGSSLDDQLGFVHYELTDGAERSAGNRLRGATNASDAGSIVSRYYERPKLADWEATKRGAMANRYGMTQMPDDALAAQRAGDERGLAFRGSFDPLAITLQSPDGKQLAPTQYLNPYFNIPTFGRPN